MTNALRPLTIGELLDRTFFLYRGHFALFVGIAAIPNLILLAFQLLRIFLDSGLLSPTQQIVSGLIWFVLTIVVYLATISLSQGATVIAVSQIQLGRETNVSEAFGAIRPRLGELSLIIVGMGLRVLIGFLLFIIPGILWSMMWSLTIPVAVIENKGLSESLARSSALTKGHRWRIFLVYLLLVALIYIVTLLLEIPMLAVVTIWGGPLVAGELPTLAQIAIPITTFVTQSLVAPIITIALSLVYYDERVRKEAFDLEHMMEQLDRTAARPFPAT